MTEINNKIFKHLKFVEPLSAKKKLFGQHRINSSGNNLMPTSPPVSPNYSPSRALKLLLLYESYVLSFVNCASAQEILNFKTYFEPGDVHFEPKMLTFRKYEK